MPIDYDAARHLLESVFAQAENDLLTGTIPELGDQIASNFDILFQSRTQAYREVLLGCTIAGSKIETSISGNPTLFKGQVLSVGGVLTRE